MIAAVVTMVHGSEAPKFGFDALGMRKASPVVDPFLIDLQERTFRFFWDTANPKNGLVPDRLHQADHAPVVEPRDRPDAVDGWRDGPDAHVDDDDFALVNRWLQGDIAEIKRRLAADEHAPGLGYIRAVLLGRV